MLKQRITTALILLPVVLLLFFTVALEFFAAAIGLVVFLVALEWAKLAGFQSIVHRAIFAVAVSLVNLGIWILEPNFATWPSLSWPNFFAADLPLIALFCGVAGFVISSLIVFSYKPSPNWWANPLVQSFLGLIMLPALFVALISIRKVAMLDEPFRGGGLVLYMFCLIWAADSGAYFAGKAFGKNKLAPVVSPNKTWEGAIGGLCLSVIVGWAGAYLLGMDIQDPLLFSGVLFFLAAASVLGDLFESAMKRVSGIKDSGQMLPGHGGFLDRLDSTVVVAPLFFLLFSKFGWL